MVSFLCLSQNSQFLVETIKTLAKAQGLRIVHGLIISTLKIIISLEGATELCYLSISTLGIYTNNLLAD